MCCRVAPQGPKQPIGLPRLALEQHMSAYKAECDVQLEVQVAARVERIKEVELAAARQEAAARWVWCIAGMGCSGCCRGLLGLIGDWGHIPCQCCQGHSRPNTWLPGKAH